MDPTPQTKPRKRLQHPDRVALDSANLNRLDEWLRQLTTQHKGIQITRTKLVNWLLSTRPATLTPNEVQELTTVFYDEEKFIRSALEEIKTAKARGEKMTLDEILIRSRPTRPPRKPLAPGAPGGTKKATVVTTTHVPEQKLEPTTPAEITPEVL